MANKAYSTINTVLKYGAGKTNPTLSKLCKIKSYPDLGAPPDTLETTDLEDESQTFVKGVQSQDNMEFTANYTPEAYAAVVATVSDEEGTYQLEMGDGGAQGIFTWTGTHSVHISGGDVNGIREMVVTVVPSSAITLVSGGQTT